MLWVVYVLVDWQVLHRSISACIQIHSQIILRCICTSDMFTFDPWNPTGLWSGPIRPSADLRDQESYNTYPPACATASML